MTFLGIFPEEFPPSRGLNTGVKMKLLSSLSILLCLSAFDAYAKETKNYNCDTDYCKFTDKVDAGTSKAFGVTCTSSDYPDATKLKCSSSNELATCSHESRVSSDTMACICANGAPGKVDFHIKQNCSAN